MFIYFALIIWVSNRIKYLNQCTQGHNPCELRSPKLDPLIIQHEKCSSRTLTWCMLLAVDTIFVCKSPLAYSELRFISCTNWLLTFQVLKLYISQWDVFISIHLTQKRRNLLSSSVYYFHLAFDSSLKWFTMLSYFTD